MRFDCRNFASRKFASWMLSAALLSSSLIAQNRSGGDGGNRGSGSSSSNDGESSAISQQFRDLIISLVKNPPKPGSLGGGMFGFFIEDAVRSERSSRCGRPFGISNNVFRPSTDRRVDTFFDRSDVRSSTGLFNWVATVLKLTDLNPALPSGVLWLLAYINSFAAFGNGNSLLDMTGAIAADGSFSGMGTGKIFGTVDVKATAAFTPMMQMPGFFGFPNGSYTLSGTPAAGPFTNQYSISATQVFSQVSYISTFASSSDDPVSAATGELYNLYDPDLDLRGLLPFQFRRYYGSYLGMNGVTSALGANWMHNFEIRLAVSGTVAKLIGFGGGMVQFNQSAGNWNLTSLGRFPYQLVASGGNFRFSDPVDELIYTFNSTGGLIRIEDRNGNVLTITQSANGPALVTDGLGRTLTFTYTGTKLTKVTDQSNRSVSFTNDATNLTSFTDAQGNITAFQYTSNKATPGLMINSTRPAGNRPYSQVYDTYARVASQVDSFGNRTSWLYNNANVSGANTVTDPLNHVTKFSHPSLLEMSGFTDAAGQSGAIAFDTLWRPSTVTDRLGNKTIVTYDRSSGFPATITDALGNRTTYIYASQTQGGFTYYRLSTVTYADGTSEAFTYDNFGNLTAETTRDGKSITNTFNSRGQVLTSTNQAGGVTTHTYNDDATEASLTNAVGEVTKFSYDTGKERVATSNASNTRDAGGRVVSTTNARGKVTKRVFDANNNLKSVTGPLNDTVAFQYDAQDRRIKTTDALGNVDTVTYNAVGRETSFTNGAGEKYTATYDVLNRFQSVADPAGKGTSFGFDAEDHLTSTTDATGATTKFTVNKVGDITRLTTPLNENFDYTWDSMRRLTAVADPLSRKYSSTYESRGLVSTMSLPGGVTATYNYAELAGLAKATDPNGNAWTYAYDKLGRLTSETDPLGQTTSYTYGRRNTLLAAANGASSAAFTYDENGNPLQKNYADGTALAFVYDDEDHLVSGNGFALGYDLNRRIALSNGLKISRDAAGRIASIQYPQGAVTYAYDSRGLLASITDWAGGKTSFAYDDARRLISIARPNGVVTARIFDKNGRLSGITESASTGTLSSIATQRDALGRITSEDRNVPLLPSPASGALPLAYDAASQIAAATYDAMGRQITGDPAAAYVWDGASRLTGYTRADGSAAFTYDGLGKLLTRTAADGSTLNYVWNYGLPLPSPAIVQDSTGDRRYYIHLPNGTLLYSIEAADSSRHFYHFDESGNTLFLTGDSGTITDSYGVTPYGESVTAGQGNTLDNPFVWQGQFGVMQDGATGLYYMRARWYDSASARFLTRDPHRSLDPRFLNPYQYAIGDPLRFTDPAGLNPANIEAVQNPSVGRKYDCVEGDVWAALGDLLYPVGNRPPMVLPNFISFDSADLPTQETYTVETPTTERDPPHYPLHIF